MYRYVNLFHEIIFIIIITGFIQHFLIRIQEQFNLFKYIILFFMYKNNRLSLLSDTKLNVMHHCRYLENIFF